MGELFQKHLLNIQKNYDSIVSNARGRGLFCAFDLPDTETRDNFVTTLMNNGLIALKCGERTVRFRPALNVSEKEVNMAAEIIDRSLRETQKGHGSVNSSGTVHTE